MTEEGHDPRVAQPLGALAPGAAGVATPGGSLALGGSRGSRLRGPLAAWTRRHPVLSFVVRRLLLGLVLVVSVSALIFVATSIVPGDPVDRILGRFATPENTAALRVHLGLDMPPVTRYLHWASGLIHGNLGISVTRSGVSVSELISGRVQNTLVLAAVATALLIPLSIGLGTWAALRVDKPADRVISGISLAFIAVPDFVVGAILVLIFAGWLAVLPPVSLVAPGQSPLAQPSILVLPIATILISSLAFGIRMVRSGMIEVMTSEYIDLARLNGIPERRVVLRHALRNALAPAIQVMALLVQWLIGGVIVVETLFGYPGIGLGLVESVTNSDYTYVQSVATLLAVGYTALFILADLLVVLLVPKLRAGATS